MYAFSIRMDQQGKNYFGNTLRNPVSIFHPFYSTSLQFIKINSILSLLAYHHKKEIQTTLSREAKILFLYIFMIFLFLFFEPFHFPIILYRMKMKTNKMMSYLYQGFKDILIKCVVSTLILFSIKFLPMYFEVKHIFNLKLSL